MPRTLRVSRLIGTLTLAMTGADLGAEESAMEKLRARLKSAEQYGTECCQMLSIPASSFQPIHTSLFTSNVEYESYGYVRTDGVMWAGVNLPTGAKLDNIDFYYFDDGAAVNSCATLMAYTGPTLLGQPPSEYQVGQACSSGSGGYGYAIEEISGTIDNSVWFSNGAHYTVTIGPFTLPLHDTVFKGVTIWWHREVGPPPGTATFNDVPTSHPQFQFIEALAESGITVGCGGGSYCPDNPLTRGQMAVFLAKALGLYWPF
jgi:S-layer homology domain